MKLLVGLGNPGRKYAKTRHNIGFLVVDALAAEFSLRWQEDDLFFVAQGEVLGQPSILIKPTTYMNESGKAVSKAAKSLLRQMLRRDEVHEDIIAFHDDIDLVLGRLKIKCGGSDAGHRGLISLTGVLGPDYVRFRLGVGRPEEGDVSDYVLGSFGRDEWATVKQIVDESRDRLSDLFSQGLAVAQRRLAKKKEV